MGDTLCDIVINFVILVLAGCLCETYMLAHVAGRGHPAVGLERLDVLGRTLQWSWREQELAFWTL